MSLGISKHILGLALGARSSGVGGPPEPDTSPLADFMTDLFQLTWD